MSWVLPSALVVATIAVAALVAAHFIARSRPVAEPLPTARFVPERAVRARARAIALSDVPLMTLRAFALAALGAAVAGPVFASAHRHTARVIIADETRAVASLAEVRDSVRALQRPGDGTIVLDGAIRGSLSSGLVAAIRAGAPLAAHNDSLELIVISPFARAEIDAGTLPLRRGWPGRARLVRVRPATIPSSDARAQVHADANDAVAAGLALAGLTTDSSNIRVERDGIGEADSVWARAPGHVLVHWPSSPAATNWPARTTIDAIGGVVSSSGALVGRFPRPWVLSGTTIARWADGEAAAVERVTGAGCIRDVALLVDEASDLTLRPSFREFARALVAPCGDATAVTPADTASVSLLAGRGSLATAAGLSASGSASSPWRPWLLAIAALVLILELALRRGAKRSAMR